MLFHAALRLGSFSSLKENKKKENRDGERGEGLEGLSRVNDQEKFGLVWGSLPLISAFNFFIKNSSSKITKMREGKI